LSDTDLYTGREQTLVKHFILRHYLARFAIIVGHRWDTITYVDCFSGPWNVQSDDFHDSSFAIALEQLRKARDIHKSRTRRTLKLRCVFLETNRSAFAKLKQFVSGITDVEIELQNKALEDAVPFILKFVKNGGSRAFPFIFIDPTGWTGFEMAAITPLLRLNPGEVLINFMTSHIRRFIASPERMTQDSFVRLFGSQDFRAKIKGLSEGLREEAAVNEYIENVKRTGNYSHTSSAIVLHPEINRTAFHLIYATRDATGIEVFKEAEKQAMLIMEKVRGEAQKRAREDRTGQGELFGGEVLHDPAYYTSLRSRYLVKAKEMVLHCVQSKHHVTYDEIWSLALSVPLTWEADLKVWIRDWARKGLLEIKGMTAGQRVPQRGKNIILMWKATTTDTNG